jgi:hypothetical protein
MFIYSLSNTCIYIYFVVFMYYSRPIHKCCVTVLVYSITMSNNVSYKLFIMAYLLLKAGIELNPGSPIVYPKRFRIVHNNV